MSVSVPITGQAVIGTASNIVRSLAKTTCNLVGIATDALAHLGSRPTPVIPQEGPPHILDVLGSLAQALAQTNVFAQAVIERDWDLANQILGKIAPDQKALFIEILQTHQELRNHEDAGRRTPLHFVSLTGHTKVAAMLVKAFPDWLAAQDSDGQTPVHYVVLNWNNDMLRTFLPALKSDPSKLEPLDKDHEDTALHQALWSGNSPAANMLLDVAKTTLFAVTNKVGANALHTAAHHGQTSVAKALFAARPDLLRTRDRAGNDVLLLAILQGHCELVEVLFQRDPSLFKERNKYGELALHTAIRYGKTDIALMIIKMCKKNGRLDLLNASDRTGSSALDLVNSKNYPRSSEIADALKMALIVTEQCGFEQS